ncbi:uncharacterized protein LOC118420431 [Branchiostoma floridae]|uniref:Uncharacterized protein LOC118420431 n=1 Tax=Branchiostoma floridae TaxID=7739 RepID=A0A9J7MY88_BRAFL|nr:uncharacterized protein LOC118420431 [Branchiostoma floridae]
MGCRKKASNLEQRTSPQGHGETEEAQSRDENHSSQGILVRGRRPDSTQRISPEEEALLNQSRGGATADEAGQNQEEARAEETGQNQEEARAEETGQNQEEARAEETGQNQEEARADEADEPRKARVKWPPSNAERQWEQLDDDPEGILEGTLAGGVERKLEAFVKIVTVYNVGLERFGEMEIGKGRPQCKQPNRREREKQKIRKDLKALRKRWRKASLEERDALSALQEELRARLRSLSKAERTRKKRRQKEKKRAEFVSNPFRFTKKLLGAKTSGRLTCSREDVESYLQKTHGDSERETPLQERPPEEFPDPRQPIRELDCSELKLAEVKEVIRKARAGSAPGPSGIPYRVYKKCPKLTRRLWSLLKVVWRKKKVPQEWKKAEGVFCPKQEKAVNIEQFRTISLLSVEAKIFFAIVAKRLLEYMMSNDYIDTSIQKGGVPGCSGCLEHTSILSQLIQEAKSGKKDLAVVWLDLENAYGSVPHKLIKVALEKYYVPAPVRHLIEQYMNGLKIRFTVNGHTTAWQSLQKGIITGCTISVILFVSAMNLVMKPALTQARGPKTESGIRQPPLKAFMDDITVTTESVISARHMLKSLSKAASWARMRFKAKKCRKLVLRKGKVCDRVQLEVQGERVPNIADQPIKSLGKKFDATLGDKNNVKDFKPLVREGLKAIENSDLPGRYKVWCYQYGLLPRTVWPMSMYNIPLTVVEEVERAVSRHLRKWLGVPPGLTSVGLYSKSAKLQLPLSSMEEEFKVTKARAQVMLQQSRDEKVSQAGIELRSGRKWTATEAVSNAASRLRHKDIVGIIAQGRRGLGAEREGSQTWGKAGPKERREMIQKEVRQREEELRRARAVGQGVQGAWTKWEGVRERRIAWKELFREPLKTTFLLKSVYDLLPTAVNLKRWGKRDEDRCVLCGKKGNLSHILSSCQVALSRGRYTWRHNQVLKVIVNALEEVRAENKGRPGKRIQPISFVKEGEKVKNIEKRHRDQPGIMTTANDWVIQADIGKQLELPKDIITTNLRPDIIMYSRRTKQLVLIELTVPWEDRVEEAQERKLQKYQELVTNCRERGWKTRNCPVEVGCRGFIAESM